MEGPWPEIRATTAVSWTTAFRSTDERQVDRCLDTFLGPRRRRQEARASESWTSSRCKLWQVGFSNRAETGKSRRAVGDRQQASGRPVEGSSVQETDGVERTAYCCDWTGAGPELQHLQADMRILPGPSGPGVDADSSEDMARLVARRRLRTRLAQAGLLGLQRLPFREIKGSRRGHH